MKTIPLTKNQTAQVSDSDFACLRRFKWSALEVRGRFYAVRMDSTGEMKYMHREILKAPKGKKTHHWDGDGTNNQRRNIVVCSNQSNLHALNPCRKPGSSQYRGVSWHTPSNKWVARVTVNCKEKYLGIFSLESAAAEAYNRAAKQHYGKFAFQNKI